MTDPTLIMLPIEKIAPAKDNVRRSVGDVSGLAASIKSVGVLQPLIVQPDGKRYRIIAGERRHAAAKAAGLAQVPAIVQTPEDRVRREAMLVENLQRLDLSALEEAAAIQQLVALGRTQKAIAQRIGVSQSHVSKRLALLRLPEEAAKALDSGGISVQDALELVTLADHPEHLAAAFERTQKHGTAKHAVEEAQRAIEDEQKIAAARAEAERQRVPLLDWPRYGEWSKQTARPISAGLHGLGLDEKRHRREPCHAAAICTERFTSFGGVGKIVWLCADPARHAAKGDSTLKVAVSHNGVGSSTQKAEQAKKKELKKAQAERGRAITKLLSVRLPRDVLVGHIVSSWVRDAGFDVTRLACQLLGLEPKPTSWGGADPKPSLRDLAASKPSDALRVGLALAAAHGEYQLRGLYPNWASAEEHLSFLIDRAGYALSDVEQRALKQARAERKKRSA